MKLEKQMLITLTDNKEYIVLTALESEGINYVYLVENDNLSNMKFCVEELENNQIKLTEVEDKNLRLILLDKFTSKLQKEN